jgi:predicted nuclease of predicted toxin-antitoxin system
MKILFDQGTPVPLRSALADHHVETAFERGWSDLANGDLLDAAERHDFDLLVTTDQHLRNQQNLAGRKLAVLVLLTTSWPRISQCLAEIRQAIENSSEGSYTELSI